MNLHRIRGVEPVHGTLAIVIHWEDAPSTVKDMTSLVHSRRVFQRLNDPQVFSQVHVADEGRAIRWTDDIDYCADALWIEAHEAMEPRPSPAAAE